ncbi:putative S-layer protein [Bacteroidota bacterium]
MNIAKIFVLMAMTLLVGITFVSAQNLDTLYVKINGDQFDEAVVGNHTNNLKLERGEDIEIKVRVKALADAKNVQVEADIYGYKYSDKEEDLVSDTSKSFDMDAGDVDTVELNLQVPVKMDKKYTLLRIRVGDEDGLSYENIYQLHVVGIDDENAVIIKDYSINPSSVINAGRAFTGMVRVENIGDDTIDDVKVTISVPELNARDSEYLDELDADEKETLEEFLIRVPDCAEPGIYDVEIEVEFDEYESTTETTQITVIPGDTCVIQKANAERTVVTVPEAQELDAGSEVAFPIIIANEGKSAKTFTVTVSGVEAWGTSRLSPSSVVVVPGEDAEIVYLYVKADSSAEGEKVFLATIASEDDSEAIPLTANVVASDDGTSLEKGLTVALVVFVIILIIIGLIIGFNKLRGQEDEGAQTYY